MTKNKPKPTTAPEKGKKRSIEEEANVEDRDKETRTTKFGDDATKGRPQVVQEKQENRQVVLPCFWGKTMPDIVLSRMKTHPPPPPAPKKAAKAKSGKKTWVDLKLRVKEDGEGRPRIEKFGQGLKESQVGKSMIFVGNGNYFMSFLFSNPKAKLAFPPPEEGGDYQQQYPAEGQRMDVKYFDIFSAFCFPINQLFSSRADLVEQQQEEGPLAVGRRVPVKVDLVNPAENAAPVKVDLIQDENRVRFWKRTLYFAKKNFKLSRTSSATK